MELTICVLTTQIVQGPRCVAVNVQEDVSPGHMVTMCLVLTSMDRESLKWNIYICALTLVSTVRPENMYFVCTLLCFIFCINYVVFCM